MTRTDTHVTAICPHMPHTLAASPYPVKRAPRCDRMPRFCVCLARMCHDLSKDDPRYLPGAAWLLEASRGVFPLRCPSEHLDGHLGNPLRRLFDALGRGMHIPHNRFSDPLTTAAIPQAAQQDGKHHHGHHRLHTMPPRQAEPGASGPGAACAPGRTDDSPSSRCAV